MEKNKYMKKINEENEDNSNNEYQINIIKKFLALSGISENEKLILNKIKPCFIFYCKEIITLYLDLHKKKTIKITEIRKRNINYIIKFFIKNSIENNKYIIPSNNEDSYNLLFMKLIIFCFAIFREVCKYKNSNKNNEVKDFIIVKLDKLLSIFVTIIGKLYCDKLIHDNQFEISLYFLIILSIAFKTTEEPNKNDKIVNMMFLKECINIIKITYNKIYECKKKFSEEQEKLFNNIILFFKENIIDYSNQKPISIINKSYLSYNDYYTTHLIDLIFIISKMKNIEIINNFVELLSNIYAFSFKYNNIMNPIVKILEPLFININLKKIEEINNELNISHFPLKLLKELIEKEEKIIKENPTFLRSGFYLGNKICGISGEINSSVGEDFLLIFGFSLHEINKEINNIKEWTLINIRNNDINKEKSKESQIKIWLSQIKDEKELYNLFVSIKQKDYQTKIKIASKKTYIFSFNFMKKKLKICYTCQYNAFCEGDEINIDNYTTNNTNIYIGCDINNQISLIKDSNTFAGFIGTVIILNQKKLSKKNQIEIPKLILSLKGDYASIISMCFENEEYKACLLDNKKKYIYKNELLYKQVHDKIIELNEKSSDLKFVESIKALISPNSFRLVEYKDEVDYLNLKNSYELYEEYKRENNSSTQNYLDFKQKSSSLNEQIIKILTSFFNNRFHVFENKNSLEEFIKYDGIIYLCLLLEYYYQILCNLNKYYIDDKQNENKIDESKNDTIISELYERIENNIYEIFEFFVNKIINKKFCENFIKEINRFLYQMTITIKQYLINQDINKKFIELIFVLLKIFINYIQEENPDESNKNVKEFKLIRNKLLDLFENLSLFFYDEKILLSKLDFYIEKINELLINEYLNDLFSKQFVDKLLKISYIFDNSNTVINKNKSLTKKLQINYTLLLIQFLKISCEDFKSKNVKPIKNEQVRKTSIFTIFEKRYKAATNIEEKKEEKIECDLKYLNYYLEYTLKTLNYPNIFSNLLTILYKAELIEKIPSKYMEQIQEILEQNYRHINKNKESQLISESSLRILSAYYLSNKENEKSLHEFLRGLEFYKGFFYSIISSLKQIKYITNDNKFIKKEQSDNNLRKISNISSEDIESKQNEGKENDIANNLDLYPLFDLDLENLNKKQNHILISLLEDCIAMLFIGNTLYISQYINENGADEIYNILMKNFDKVFQVKGKNIYNDLFSSEKEITSELFFFKWKLSNSEKKEEIIKDVQKYSKDLLKNHSFPFIYKFILLINLELYYQKPKEEKILNEANLNAIIDLLCFIYNELDNYFEDHNPKNKNENYSFFICNTINLLVLINKIFIKEESQIIFKYKKFQDMFIKLVNLLDKTGLLYSNYCFEVEENNGKIISEICYDLFINFLNFSYSKDIKNIFYELFIKENRQRKEFYCIFYLIDLNKEDLLKKDKKTKEDLLRYIKEYSSLKYIHKNIFIQKEPKKKFKIFGKKISKIEEVNFTLYFLSKSFLYLLSSGISKELQNLFLETFLPVIIENIYRLWTKKSQFYGHKICKRFLLYSEAKSFFEAHVIQDPFNLEKYKEFFEIDIPAKIKDQFKLAKCFASRLLDKKEYNFDVNNQAKEAELPNFKVKKSNSLKINRTNDKIIINFEFNCRDCLFLFEKLEKKYIIYNQKNYLMKIIFSSTFKDILFKDKIFQNIRSTYLCTFRQNKALIIKTKQLNYPVREKNFSNSLEPKHFLCKDNKFYQEEFFNVSHNYLKKNPLKTNDIKKVYFYPHEYFLKEHFKKKRPTFDCELKKSIFEHDLNKSIFDCELITNQFIYFGKMYIGEEFIYFETEKEQRDNNKNYFNYIFSTKDNDNKTTKQKSILIFIKDLKEIIIRRTLLMRQSIEIFSKNGKSFFFNFFKSKICTRVYNIFVNINQSLLLKDKKQFNLISKDFKSEIKKVITSFKNGDITNYEYLLHLNKLSSRSYNDLTQYPIFPWLVIKIDKLRDITNTDEPAFENNVINKGKGENLESCLRDMNYPISMQSCDKREDEIAKFLEDSKTSNYSYHCGTHYSTSSYVFYYLMRINPFGQNLIKLQNYKQENPNRMFLSFRETQLILETSTDNRELIPDLYCYIDYLCNLNCSYLGTRMNMNIVDDFYINNINITFEENTNLISSFVESLYRHKKLLNCLSTKKKLDKWVDIIFGKKQIPPKEEAPYSCNIFSKLTYEQNINLEKKLEKYQKMKIDVNMIKSKIQNKINIINNFGICPSQILNETVAYEDPIINNPIPTKPKKNIVKGEYFYFTKINKNQYLSINDHSNKGTIKNAHIYEDNIEKDISIYHIGNFINDISYLNINSDNPLYKPNYCISQITLMNKFSEKKEMFILTCRFLGNYFKIQNSEIIKMILCEDFVTTIIARNSDENDNAFYTGLKNGKLIEWKLKIAEIIYSNNKKKNQSSSTFIIKEKKHVYAHKYSITAIEINNSKQIIATSGEDKFIYIRKLYDFELLTSIDLTYTFGNPIISKCPNIFPSLIKISDLNCIYVLLYDYTLQKTMIRGYTLNGLFFCQTDEYNTGEGNNDLSYNNICFNKNWNLIVGLYNSNKIILLNSFDLKAKYQKRIVEEKNQDKHHGTKWIEYDSFNKELIALYDNECKIIELKKEEKSMFDS